MGLTFKENCPDLRNSKVVDVIQELKNYGIKVDAYDPWVDKREAQHEYGLKPVDHPRNGAYDAIVIAVGHKQFKELGLAKVRAFGKRKHVLYDIKYLFPASKVDGRL